MPAFLNLRFNLHTLAVLKLSNEIEIEQQYFRKLMRSKLQVKIGNIERQIETVKFSS